MTNLVGTYVTCLLTLWFYIPQLKKPVPHTGYFVCQVKEWNETKVDTGLAPEIYVDCTESIGWLKTSHPKKFWTRLEEGRCL